MKLQDAERQVANFLFKVWYVCFLPSLAWSPLLLHQHNWCPQILKKQHEPPAPCKDEHDGLGSKAEDARHESWVQCFSVDLVGKQQEGHA